MKEDLHKLSEACSQETNVSEEEMKKFFIGGLKDEDAKDNLKCQMKCIMEKKGHFKNGALDADATKKFLDSIPEAKDHQDMINKAITECKDKKGANDCDTAYLITKCMAEHKAMM